MPTKHTFGQTELAEQQYNTALRVAPVRLRSGVGTV